MSSVTPGSVSLRASDLSCHSSFALLGHNECPAPANPRHILSHTVGPSQPNQQGHAHPSGGVSGLPSPSAPVLGPRCHLPAGPCFPLLPFSYHFPLSISFHSSFLPKHTSTCGCMCAPGPFLDFFPIPGTLHLHIVYQEKLNEALFL